MCFVQSVEKTLFLPSFIILELESKDIRLNQHRTKRTEQHIEVGTVSRWNICEAVLKGAVGTMLDSRKDTERAFQQNERRKYTKSHLFRERGREDDGTVILRRADLGVVGSNELSYRWKGFYI